MSENSLKLKDIKIDGGTQPRTEIDEALVAEYAEAMAGGAEFPPVVVFYDGVTYWLADGFHRSHAARRASLQEIVADVREGTQRDAILYSVGANASHGQRRTNADKRKAVMTLLEDEEWSQWSNEAVAKQCAVDPKTVGKYRAETESHSGSSGVSPPRTYTTKHGTTATMDTSRIGKRESAQPDNSGNESAQPDERPKTESRGQGLRLAHEAIQVLHKIPHNDGLRDEAFDTVIEWIESNR